MHIKVPHPKNARKWGKADIVFDVAQLIHTYLGAPCKALLLDLYKHATFEFIGL